jgi:hypothetical protein
MDEIPRPDTVAPATAEPVATDDTNDFVYAYRASLMGAPFEFRLTPAGLAWQKGRFTGETPYGQVRRLRLSFRPVTMQSQRFLAEVWPAAGTGPKLQIASTSVRGLVEQERQDAAYRAFILELHRRMAAAGATTSFERGTLPVLYWPGLIVFFAAALALAALAVHASVAGTWSAVAIVAAFFILLLWHMGPFFRRNRPGTYRPDAVPDEVLPRGT